MKKNRLTYSDRTYMTVNKVMTMELRQDHARRLRNALLSMAQTDPTWMIWLEKNFKPHPTIRDRDLLMIEARARHLVLKRYRFLGRSQVGGLLFAHDWPFTDAGSLSPG